MNYKAKMKAYRIGKQFKLAEQLLTGVETIDSISLYVSEGLEANNELRRTTFGLNVTPSSRLSAKTQKTEVDQWLSNLLGKLGFQKETQLLLHLDQFDESFWILISVVSSDKWLHSLWNKLTTCSLAIASVEGNSLLVLSEEEYHYDAFIFE